jgi:3-oxoacyl-[acyl-carrier protein] reductase
MRETFSGSRALILGGACELALTLARCLMEASLYPILTYRNERGRQAIGEALAPFAGQYETQYLNFGDRPSLTALFKNIDDDLDFLVDFVHEDYESLIASADEESVERYFAGNVSFRAEVLKRAGRAMLKKRRGRLIYISSTAAERPNPGQGFYSAAKLASEALYRAMGLEMGERGITTAILRPGYVAAGRGAAYMEKEKAGKKPLEMIPIKRAITAMEVARAILFLLSDSARGVNATAIVLDGGLTAGK